MQKKKKKKKKGNNNIINHNLFQKFLQTSNYYLENNKIKIYWRRGQYASYSNLLRKANLSLCEKIPQSENSLQVLINFNRLQLVVSSVNLDWLTVGWTVK